MGTPRRTLFALLVTSAWAFSAHGEHARGALGSVEASPEPAQSAQAATPSPLGDLQPRLILPTPGSLRGAAGDAATATATVKPVAATAPNAGTPSKPAPQVGVAAQSAAAGGATNGALIGPLSNIAVINSKGGGSITNSSDKALGLGAVDPRDVMKMPKVEVGTLNLGSLATPPLTTMPAVGNVQYGPSGGGGGGK